MPSSSRGLILMLSEIFFSSSSCSLVLVISRLASFAGPASGLLVLLCLHHLLPLFLGLFQSLSLLFGLLCFLLGLFLPESLLFLFLLLGEFFSPARHGSLFAWPVSPSVASALPPPWPSVCATH